MTRRPTFRGRFGDSRAGSNLRNYEASVRSFRSAGWAEGLPQSWGCRPVWRQRPLAQARRLRRRSPPTLSFRPKAGEPQVKLYNKQNPGQAKHGVLAALRRDNPVPPSLQKTTATTSCQPSVRFTGQNTTTTPIKPSHTHKSSKNNQPLKAPSKHDLCRKTLSQTRSDSLDFRPITKKRKISRKGAKGKKPAESAKACRIQYPPLTLSSEP